MKRNTETSTSTKNALSSHQTAFDAKQLNAKAIARLPAIAKRLLPKGRIRGPYWNAINPTRVGETSETLSVKLTDGTWSDFWAGESGKDVVGLIAHLTQLDRSAAETAMRKLLGDPDEA